METFTLDWGRSRLVRLLGRNDLVRISDRLEMLAAAVAVIAVIVAIPFAVTFGSWVKDARASVYAQQAQTRQETTATALETSVLRAQVYTHTFEVRARWAAEGSMHSATVTVPEMVHQGDRFDIWIDDQGNYTKAPTSLREAVAEAIGWAVLSWAAGIVVLAVGVCGLHWRLDRARSAAWDRDLAMLVRDDGGRANREP